MSTPPTRGTVDARIRRSRGLTAIDAALVMISVLLIVQMWLLTATLEAWLAGRVDALLPATIVSGVLLLAVFGLSRFIAGVDRDLKKGPPGK